MDYNPTTEIQVISRGGNVAFLIPCGQVVHLDFERFRNRDQSVERNVFCARFEAANESGIVIHEASQAALAQAFGTAHIPNVFAKDAPVSPMFRGWSHLGDLELGKLQSSGIVAIQPISTVFLKRYLF